MIITVIKCTWRNHISVIWIFKSEFIRREQEVIVGQRGRIIIIIIIDIVVVVILVLLFEWNIKERWWWWWEKGMVVWIMGWEGIVIIIIIIIMEAKYEGIRVWKMKIIMIMMGVPYDLRVKQVRTSVMAIIGGFVERRKLLDFLNLFDCLASLIKLVCAPEVVPAYIINLPTQIN